MPFNCLKRNVFFISPKMGVFSPEVSTFRLKLAVKNRTLSVKWAEDWSSSSSRPYMHSHRISKEYVIYLI